MSKILSSFLAITKRNMGFTMIELLIVISILGILAVAVLSAINPIEQINRGKDTGSRSDAEQLISAIDRYYTFNGYYPWQIGVGDTGHKAQGWLGVADATLADTDGCLVTDKLGQGNTTTPCSGADELKATFLSRIVKTTTNPLFIYNHGDQGDSTYVCFVPQSKAFLDEATKRCGTAGAGMPSDVAGIKDTLCGGTASTTWSCLP